MKWNSIVLTALIALRATSPSVLAAEPVDVGSRLELFVDDFLIDRLSGDATRQLQEPEPREVVLVTGEPWEGNTSAYYTVFRDGDIFRMYYRGAHWDEVNKRETHPEVTCYAESKDGIHWTRPRLGLFEFGGSKENNIVLVGNGTHCFTAFKDANPDCRPEARYKGLTSGHPRAAMCTRIWSVLPVTSSHRTSDMSGDSYSTS